MNNQSQDSLGVEINKFPYEEIDQVWLENSSTIFMIMANDYSQWQIKITLRWAHLFYCENSKNSHI